MSHITRVLPPGLRDDLQLLYRYVRPGSARTQPNTVLAMTDVQGRLTNERRIATRSTERSRNSQTARDTQFHDCFILFRTQHDDDIRRTPPLLSTSSFLLLITLPALIIASLLSGRRSIPTLLLLLLVVPQFLAQEPLELFVRDDLVRLDLFTVGARNIRRH